MTPLVLGLGVPELLIILAVVLLLFGGSRLAGIGKSTGRAIKEFKSETRGLEGEQDPKAKPPAVTEDPSYEQPPSGSTAADASTSDPRRDA
jgi:sec-independent protein translocase protein TatA